MFSESNLSDENQFNGIPIESLNLRNITVRTRSNVKGGSKVPCKSANITEDRSESFFGSDTDLSGEFETKDPNIFIKENKITPTCRTKSTSKKRPTVTPKNDTYVTNNIEYFLSCLPHSTPRNSRRFSKSKSGQRSESSGVKCKNSSKTLFPQDEPKCYSCKKPITPPNSKTTSKDLKNTTECDSSFCDSNYTRCFQPPCSSTKLFGIDKCLTPAVNDMQLPKQLPISGVKRLKSPIQEEIQNKVHIDPRNEDSNFDNEQNDAQEIDDFPCTQPVTSIILRGVIAYIDVKFATVQTSEYIKVELLALGAEVEEKFTKRVTHVIFREGSLTTYKTARRRKIPLVSIVWLNECKKALTLLPIDDFDPPGLEAYENRINKQTGIDIFDIMNTKKKTTRRKLNKIELITKRRLEALKTAQENDVKDANRLANVPGTPPNDESVVALIKDFINNQPSDLQDMINCSESPTEDIHVAIPIKVLRQWKSPRKVKTDIKEIKNKKSSKLSRFTERRKNLHDLLNPLERNAEKENDSTDHSSDRRSAPSEIMTSAYQRVDEIKPFGELKKKSDSDEKEELLTQNTRKRRLLPLDLAPNELMNDSTENNSFDLTISNPYGSPKQSTKTRKVVTSNKKKNHLKKQTIKAISKVAALGSGLKPIYEKDNRTSMSRRSSQVFVNKRTLRKDKLLPSIVCTGLSKSNLETVHSVVKSLGRFEIEKEVTSRTSHVVVEKENFRTVKLLNGIVRGCWIVSCEWVFSSFEAGKWLSEDKYEITSFSPAVRLNRCDRQAFGPEYNCDLFKECGTFFVSAKCSPPTEDLKQLITLCSGRLVGVCRSADIIIGGKPSLMYKGHHVSEKWVLDCITKFRVLDFDEYALQELKLSLS